MHIRHIRRTNFDSFCPLETNFSSLTNVARATHEQEKESFYVYVSTRDIRFLTRQSEKSVAFAVSKIVFFFVKWLHNDNQWKTGSEILLYGNSQSMTKYLRVDSDSFYVKQTVTCRQEKLPVHCSQFSFWSVSFLLGCPVPVVTL